MAVVLASIAYWAVVEFTLVGDKGTPETIVFDARYKRLKTSERKKLDEDLKSPGIPDKEFLDRVLVDWNLKYNTGAPVIYTEATRAEAVEEWDGLESALVTAFFVNARKSHEAAAAAKNSEALSATPSAQTAQTATS